MQNCLQSPSHHREIFRGARYENGVSCGQTLSTQYKIHAFHYLTRGLKVGSTSLNLTVVGDSPAEHEAGVKLKQ